MNRLVTPFGFASTTSDVLRGVDLSGKTALVTGANSGIGYETARALAGAGAAVVVAARRDRAGSDAAAQIAASTGNPHVSHVLLDLADLESAARVAAAWSGPLHILVNNAGIMAVPELTRTAQGHELQFATNYLGHFVLTAGLRTALAAAGGARIVSLSSNAHLYSPVVFGDLDFRFRPYDPLQAYAESKTAAVLLAVELTRRWSGEGVYANAANPGAIATGLQQYTGGLKTPVDRRKSVAQGAATSVFLAASPLAEGIGGRYFEDVSEADTRTERPGMFGTGVADYALEPRYAELLWEVSTQMVYGPETPAGQT
ncbi:MAG TPA: SDR family NAD(P)-dependent oxidoreductase [Streptosporangiaceae bacterium]|nr:SDR family NAD(P)-dependent oxidoreductase [Streptosporangiaceae bacterium]